MSKKEKKEIDAFKILKLDRKTATPEDVKEAFNKLSKKFHPDRQKTALDRKKAEELFKILSKSKEVALEELKSNGGISINIPEPSSFFQMKDSVTKPEFKIDQTLANQLTGRNGNGINIQKFNEIFNQSKTSSNNGSGSGSGNSGGIAKGFVFNISEQDYVDKSESQRIRERSNVDSILSTIQPIFEGGRNFDNNSFQRMFEHHHGTAEQRTKELEVYKEPELLTSGLQPYSELDEEGDGFKESSNISRLTFAEFEQQRELMNPSKIDRSLLEDFRRQKDITSVNQLEADYASNIKKKMNDYRSTDIVIPKSGITPDFSRPINNGFDNGNSKGRAKKTELVSLVENYNNMRPVSTSVFNENTKRGTQDRRMNGQFPSSSPSSNSSSELEKMRITIEEQQKIINTLLHPGSAGTGQGSRMF